MSYIPFHVLITLLSTACINAMDTTQLPTLSPSLSPLMPHNTRAQEYASPTLDTPLLALSTLSLSEQLFVLPEQTLITPNTAAPEHTKHQQIFARYPIAHNSPYYCRIAYGHTVCQDKESLESLIEPERISFSPCGNYGTYWSNITRKTTTSNSSPYYIEYPQYHENTLILIDTRTGTQLRTIASFKDTTQLTWSSQGKFLLIDDGIALQIWRAEDNNITIDTDIYAETIKMLGKKLLLEQSSLDRRTKEKLSMIRLQPSLVRALIIKDFTQQHFGDNNKITMSDLHGQLRELTQTLIDESFDTTTIQSVCSDSSHYSDPFLISNKGLLARNGSSSVNIMSLNDTTSASTTIPEANLYGTNWSPCGNYIAVSGEDNEGNYGIKIIHVQCKKTIFSDYISCSLQTTLSADDTWCSKWSPCGTLYANKAYKATSLKIWNPLTGELRNELPVPQNAYFYWSPSGTYVIVCDETSIHIWHAHTGEKVGEWYTPENSAPTNWTWSTCRTFLMSKDYICLSPLCLLPNLSYDQQVMVQALQQACVEQKLDAFLNDMQQHEHLRSVFDSLPR